LRGWPHTHQASCGDQLGRGKRVVRYIEKNADQEISESKGAEKETTS